MTTKAEVKPKSKLKAIVPEKLEKRLKMFLYGPAGVGKTLASLQFPNAYIIDTERGCENYGETIKKSGSVVFQSNNFDDIKDEIHALLTENHDFKTLIVDPITILYGEIQDQWAKKIDPSDIRYWGRVKGDYKSLQRLMLRLDMNVLVTSHQKILYGQNFQKLGVTFDAEKSTDYFFDNVFRLENRGGKRFAITEKERCEIGKNKFPDEFEWSYQNFLKFYGSVIEKKSEAVPMATKEQVSKILKLLETVKVGEDWIDKCFQKAGVDEWNEMTSEQITKCIDHCEKKLMQIKNSEEE